MLAKILIAILASCLLFVVGYLAGRLRESLIWAKIFASRRYFILDRANLTVRHFPREGPNLPGDCGDNYEFHRTRDCPHFNYRMIALFDLQRGSGPPSSKELS